MKNTIKAKAFCPAHITGLFEIKNDEPYPLKKGSRGGGLCLALGARSDVEITNKPTRILINGKESEAPVTRFILKSLLKNRPYNAIVKTKLDLPMGQGFGMSGAGALSSALALKKALAIKDSSEPTFEQVYQIAHIAEVTYLSGLGDISAMIQGGFPLRSEEGPPPFGKVSGISTEGWNDASVFVAVLGPPLSTKSVLQNPSKKEFINKAGTNLVDRLIEEPTIKNLFRLSYEFAKLSGLMSIEVSSACEKLNKFGSCSMAMLGNSIFFIPDNEMTLVDIQHIVKAEQWFETKINYQGCE